MSDEEKRVYSAAGIAVRSFAELPKTTVYITRDWVARGIREREAWVLSGTAVTDEDRGDGTKWTPYSVGFDAHLTREEAQQRVADVGVKILAENARAADGLRAAMARCVAPAAKPTVTVGLDEQLLRDDPIGIGAAGRGYTREMAEKRAAETRDSGQSRNFVGGLVGRSAESVAVEKQIASTTEVILKEANMEPSSAAPAPAERPAGQYPVKQVILMRSDLKNTKGQKVRSGKLMAQSAHAAMIWLSKRLQAMFRGGAYLFDPADDFTADEQAWLFGAFAKITLEVGSEAELLLLVEQARAAGLQAEVCVDNGATEFGGVPTVTCAAIGPAAAEKIDKITGKLRPL